MTLNQIIYNIRTLIRDNKSDDLKFTDRNIEFWIRYLRTKLIRQDYQKGRSISDNVIQQLPSVKIVSVDAAESDSISIGKDVLRTENPIPKFISTPNGDMLTSIYGLDKVTPVNIQPKARAIRNKYNKYGSKIPVAYLDGGHLYFIGCNFYSEYITIEGVFEDPKEVFEFNNPGEDYDANLEEYPIEGHMIDTINSMVKANELNLYFQIPEDRVNDSQTNI